MLEVRTLLLEMTRLGMVWSFLPGLPPLLVVGLDVGRERPLRIVASPRVSCGCDHDPFCCMFSGIFIDNWPLGCVGGGL